MFAPLVNTAYKRVGYAEEKSGDKISCERLITIITCEPKTVSKSFSSSSKHSPRI